MKTTTSPRRPSGANTAVHGITHSTTAPPEPIAQTKDARDIYVGDYVKVVGEIRFLKVIKLDETSPPDRPILTCYGGDRPESENPRLQWVSVYADTCKYQYPIKKTVSMRKRKWA